MIRTPALLLLVAVLLVPGSLLAQSMLGQSRPGGAQGGTPQGGTPQGGTQGGPAPLPSTAPLAPVQVLPLPAVTAPGAAQQAQPMPAPAPQLQPAPTQPATTQPATPATATPPVPIPGEWVAQGTAELRGIDKVTARTAPLTAKVGETSRFGPLTVTVRGCAIRTPDLPQDATAFLEIAEAGQAPLFRGWMLLSQPQLGIVEHATHDIRLFACRP
jgi:hypothetical protein